MTDLTTLAEQLRLGCVPDWQPMVAMNVGDALIATIELADDRHGDIRRMEDKLDDYRLALVAFGALDADDDETDPLELVKLLLPPNQITEND